MDNGEEAMPKIPAERLTEIGQALFEAAGAPPAEAELVMRHIISANLAGHDSHGVIQIPTYIDRIKAGHIVPGAPWTIVQESPATTVVDGHWGFGYVANERAMRLTIDKAKTANVAAATVFRQGHIGRLSSYTQMAAQAVMIGLISRGRSISTWQPRPPPPARSRSPSPATSRCRTIGSSAMTGGQPTTRASCARAGRCCRSAGRRAATRAPGSRSWSRSCAAC
jgi:hypothetical protein